MCSGKGRGLSSPTVRLPLRHVNPLSPVSLIPWNVTLYHDCTMVSFDGSRLKPEKGVSLISQVWIGHSLTGRVFSLGFKIVREGDVRFHDSPRFIWVFRLTRTPWWITCLLTSLLSESSVVSWGKLTNLLGEFFRTRFIWVWRFYYFYLWI